MAQSFTLQSLTTLFSFPFKDPRWKAKCLVGVGLTFVSFLTLFIPFIFVIGYVYQIMRRIILENGEPYLPEWEDWGRLFNDGMRLAGAGVVLSAPIILFLFIAILLGMLPSFVFMTTSQSGSIDSPLFPLLTLFSLVPFGLVMVFSLLIGILSPVVMGHVVATHAWTAVFQVKEWWKVFRANLGGFLISYGVVIAVSYVTTIAVQLLNFTLIFFCLVPIMLTCLVFYISLISYPIYAIAYRAGVQNLSEAQT
jgi:hypothetical protein